LGLGPLSQQCFQRYLEARQRLLFGGGHGSVLSPHAFILYVVIALSAFVGRACQGAAPAIHNSEGSFTA
jgi:hypothetical protein